MTLQLKRNREIQQALATYAYDGSHPMTTRFLHRTLAGAQLRACWLVLWFGYRVVRIVDTGFQDEPYEVQGERSPV